MSTLYVTEPGARLEKEYRRILVTKEGEVLVSIPLRLVSEVVLVGWVGATTPAMLSLLDQGAGFSLVARSGKLRGRLRPAEAPNLPLRQKQYAAVQDTTLRLVVTRAVVAGKLANSRVLAMRIMRRLRHTSEGTALEELTRQFNRLEESLRKVPDAADADTLRGLEGTAARAYFAVLRGGLCWQGDHSFEKRNRRPPRDPVNAMLSFGYSLLTDSLFTACELVGLDPYAGFFHADKYGRPALALDLVEEFRPIVVDSVVLRLVNKRIIKPGDFTWGNGKSDGVFLKPKGLRAFLGEFNRRLNTEVYHPAAGRSLAYRKCFEVQARQIRKVIEGSQPQYIPFKVR